MVTSVVYQSYLSALTGVRQPHPQGWRHKE
jgi:hypothetical protein